MNAPKKTGRPGRAAPGRSKAADKPAGARGRTSGPGANEGSSQARRAPTGARQKPGGARRPRTGEAPPALDAPPAEAVFKDRDGQAHTFPDSSLRRVAARLLTEKRKLWRYRPFSFPLFTSTGREQQFTPDFVVYDNQEAVLRVLLIAPRDTAEIWDRLGRFKRQYPMYPYELWTPEKLAQFTGPRGRLSF